MAAEYLLEMDGISKAFPGVRALDQVSLCIRPGEIHALMGANGAGKSTLMKVLAGIFQPDAGRILLQGEAVTIKNPAHARQLGIGIVFQELSVFPHLSVLENIFIGREETGGGLYKWKAMQRRARGILEELDIPLNIHQKVGDLPIAQQQMVEIAGAVSSDAKLIILDEPTSSLSVREVETLYRMIRGLQQRGVAVVYISHRMDEIFTIAQRITLLRDGRQIFTEDIGSVTRERLIHGIIGRRLEEEFPQRTAPMEEELLRVTGLTSRGHYQNIRFSLRAGEVLGFAGLVGAGRTQVGKTIFGEFPRQAGEMLVEGRPFSPRGSGEALRRGVAYATEDRKTEGLLLDRSIRENASLASLDRVIPRLLIDRKRERRDVEAVTQKLAVKTPSLEQKAVHLSGGNQQKVCLAKWMLANPKILILDEPTRGIDVGAKAEFYRIIAALAAEGVGVILISSEENELIGLCDRILVFREGAIAGEVVPQTDCEKEIMQLMLGVADREPGRGMGGSS